MKLQPRAIPAALTMLITVCVLSATANEETAKFVSNYGVSLDVPASWPRDSAETRKAKVRVTELLADLKLSDGKVRLLNTGTDHSSPLGYSRVRLSILSDAQFSQAEVRELGEQEVALIRAETARNLKNNPLFKVDPDSINVAITRIDDKYWGYRISYTRTGMRGEVRVNQFYVPFTNRAVLLTMSNQIAKKSVAGPIQLRILASLKLNDPQLWPIAPK